MKTIISALVAVAFIFAYSAAPASAAVFGLKNEYRPGANNLGKSRDKDKDKGDKDAKGKDGKAGDKGGKESKGKKS